MAGPVIADQVTCSLKSSGASEASTSGRIRRLSLSSASIPLATASIIMPGFNKEANCSPAQRTPKELTPLMAISTPSNASSASSSW